MNCPVCNLALVMTDRQGVEIDYCPRCRGVWLDRGELDKIIERSDAAYAGGTAPRVSHERHDKYDEHHYEPSRYTEHGSYYPQQPYKKHKKRESFLSELFDFD